MSHLPHYVCAESAAGCCGLPDSLASGTIGHPKQGIVAGLLLRAAAAAGGK